MLLQKYQFDPAKINSYGNMFLIGNGHIGYRGTLEEYSQSQFVGLNMIGHYDQYRDSWRESLNLFNPFFVKVQTDEKVFSVLENTPLTHEQSLDLITATHQRKTEYPELIIESKRIVFHKQDEYLATEYKILAKKSLNLSVLTGIDSAVWEINGPHYLHREYHGDNHLLAVSSRTNENLFVHTVAKYFFSKEDSIKQISTDNGIFLNHQFSLLANECFTLKIIARVRVAQRDYLKMDLRQIDKYTAQNFNSAFTKNQIIFAKKWETANVDVVGDAELDFSLKYSIYHLLILGNKNYSTSIPARGVSGQTYKGAIFWDTEIFMLPFFLLTNDKVARRLIEYRIKSLPGALAKAKRFNHVGAFYAWESQERGKEACSLFNVRDALTNQPIRTYFVDKQIHISADVAYGIEKYVIYTGDKTILDQGGYLVLLQIMKFLRFYSFYNSETKLFEIHDVIGPDEYHERVNNNAFTNYLVYEVGKSAVQLFKEASPLQIAQLEEMAGITVAAIEYYLEKLYLPPPNEKGIIEQFDGYFSCEDVDVKTVRARLKNEKEYWGGEAGVASKTRVIKQADVIAVFGLFPHLFSKEIIKANYDFYSPYTEHGSSLSTSMYGLAAIRCGYLDDAYEMMKKSAMIDLGEAQKQWAGSIYIGGTHPASNGGAYLCAIYGFAGLDIIDGNITFSPQLAKRIRKISFAYSRRGKKYIKTIKGD